MNGYRPHLGRVVLTAKVDGETIVNGIATETVMTTGPTVVRVARGPVMKVVRTAPVMEIDGDGDGTGTFKATLVCWSLDVAWHLCIL